MPWCALPRRTFIWINLLAFKVIWLLLVLLQNQFVLPVLAITAMLLLLYPDKHLVWRYCALIALPGILLDSALSLGGVFQFPENIVPLWLMVLWVNFALTLPHGFAFIQAYSRSVQAAIGAIASFSYLIGWRLGAVAFPNSVLITQSLLVLLWAGLLPLFILLIQQQREVAAYE